MKTKATELEELIRRAGKEAGERAGEELAQAFTAKLLDLFNDSDGSKTTFGKAKLRELGVIEPLSVEDNLALADVYRAAWAEAARKAARKLLR